MTKTEDLENSTDTETLQENSPEQLPNSTTSLNLKYLVDTQEKKTFPVFFCCFALFCLSLISIVVWFSYHKKRPHVIKHRAAIGESLRSLAVRYYRDPKQWRRIFLANRDKLIKQRTLVAGDIYLIPVTVKKTGK